MARNKKYESGSRKEIVDKVQSPTPVAGAHNNPRKGAKAAPPDVEKNRVESKPPGSGVYCDERANRLSCTPPAPPQAAPEPIVKSEPKAEKINKPAAAPAESGVKE